MSAERFIIQAKGARAFHIVSGDLDAIPPSEAWRRPERTLCGRALVPLNYFVIEERDAWAHMCRQCEPRLGLSRVRGAA